MRILIVTLREGNCIVIAPNISNKRLDLFINAEPQPRLQTRSMGQAEFRSYEVNNKNNLINYTTNKVYSIKYYYHYYNIYGIIFVNYTSIVYIIHHTFNSYYKLQHIAMI